MKVLLVSYSLEGGAGGATDRLHRGLRHIGVDSWVLVQKKTTPQPTEVTTAATRAGRALDRLRPAIDRLPLRRYPNRTGLFFPQWFPDAARKRVAQLKPDLINLHWVRSGTVRLETVATFRRPLVWTLPDMGAFTGGCDYSRTCERYVETCGRCPILNSSRDKDLSRRIWQRKAKAWHSVPFTVVTPSSWLAACARASSLFKDRRIEVIPYGLDTTQFKPVNRREARAMLGLPHNRRIVLFGAWAGDRRKGLHLLQEALQKLSRAGWGSRMALAVFGPPAANTPDSSDFQTFNLGRFHDTLSLSVVYSAADVMVAPSIQEGFGQTASESLACGTPAVVFGGTGLSDIVDHRQNGYVARPFEVDDLAQGIAWVLQDDERRGQLSRAARQKVEREYALAVQARRYAALFDEVIANHRRAVSQKERL